MPKIKYKIGIDEVGRGPLAGPVTVAAFLMPISEKSFNIVDVITSSEIIDL